MNWKKILALLLVLVVSVSMFSGCGNKETGEAAPVAEGEAATPEAVTPPATPKGAEELNLYTWEGMFPQDVLNDFTTETGIKINYSNFDTDEAMLAKLQADKKGGYDLVIADDYIIKTSIDEGLVQPLNLELLPNFGNIAPEYQGWFYDEKNEYTVPYGAGVQTIVYNPAEVEIEIKGYKDLWDTSLVNQIGIIGNYRVINGMALKTMGESYNTEDVELIKQAGERLKELGPNIRTITDDNLQDKILTGEVNVAIMYTSQVTQALMANPELKAVFPEEGIGFGIMAQFIPANAPNPEAAHAFMNYILQPEVAAKCFENFGYYSTNKAANEFIAPEYQDFLILPEGFAENMEIIMPVGQEAEDAHSLVWTEFQASR